MMRSLLIGLAAGPRALTPLALVSEAARRGALPPDSGAPGWLGRPAISALLKLLAGAELWGDKLRSAPNRIVPAGVLARTLSGALAGAALAPRRRAVAGAAVGAAAAVASAHLSFWMRTAAMRRLGQTTTGLIEDALTFAAATWIAAGVSARVTPSPPTARLR